MIGWQRKVGEKSDKSWEWKRIRGWDKEAMKERKRKNSEEDKPKSTLCVMDTLLSDESLRV